MKATPKGRLYLLNINIKRRLILLLNRSDAMHSALCVLLVRASVYDVYRLLHLYRILGLQRWLFRDRILLHPDSL